jgi:aminodeoxychorismate lyase
MFVYLNGAYVPKEQAFISVDDRGFRFGDGLFETIAVCGGMPQRIEAHLKRLHDGVQALHFPPLHQALAEIITQLITRNHVRDGVARIIITRGCGSRGYLPTSTTPTCYVEALSQSIALAQHTPPSPIRLRLSHYTRINADALPTFAKMTNAMNLTLARMEAAYHGVDDVLLCTSDGMIAETSSGNLIWREGDTFFTPCESTGCVAGTMRDHLMQHMPITTVRATPAQLAHADAVLMTNALSGVVPITQIDDVYFPHSVTWARELWGICNNRY